MIHDFSVDVAFSETQVNEACCRTIKAMLMGCDSIETVPGNTALNKRGVDYIAKVGIVEVFIDHKARRYGCGRMWKSDNNGRRVPELALET